ncbi:MAG: MFS transporter [Actinobacteria bacterium]|nr:MFS transporter [Actinomycetota bacterium]
MNSTHKPPLAETPAYAGTPVIVVLACTGMTVSLMQTLVVPLTPVLPQLFKTSAANASWVITATLLVAAVATPIMGRLGDLFGKKRMLMVCVGFLAASSVVCAVGDSLITAIIGRGIQGLGIAAIPLGISLLRDVVEPARLGPSVALISSSLGAGGALGLPIAAFIADNWGWSELFWFATAVSLVCAVSIAVVVPESPQRVKGSVDFAGVVGLAVLLVSLLLVISKGAAWGWISSRVGGLLALAAFTAVIWGRWELRVESPAVDLRSTARKPVLMTNLASVMTGFTMYAMNLLAPQMLMGPEATGFGAGRSILAAGLWMAPAGLIMVAMSQVAARLTQAYGAKMSLLLGIVIMCVGNVVVQFTLTTGSPWSVVAFASIVSVGVSFAYASMPTLIMANVPISETAAANGLNSLARSFGTSAASAVVGAVIGQMTVAIGGYPFVSTAGVRTALAICTVAGVIAALLTMAIPSRPDAVEGSGSGTGDGSRAEAGARG